MSKLVKVRRLSDHEGRELQHVVRRGGGRSEKSIVRWRQAMVVLASASGNSVPAIARFVQTSEDRVREMIQRLNELGMSSLAPQWAGGRPRQITTDDETFIVTPATTRPEKLGQPFTRWSLRKLVAYLQVASHRITIPRVPGSVRRGPSHSEDHFLTPCAIISLSMSDRCRNKAPAYSGTSP